MIEKGDGVARTAHTRFKRPQFPLTVVVTADGQTRFEDTVQVGECPKDLQLPAVPGSVVRVFSRGEVLVEREDLVRRLPLTWTIGVFG